MSRLRRNAADAFGLFVVPALLSLLPWRIAFAALKRLARRGLSFRPEADAAWSVASRHLEATDVDEWKTRYRLMRWVERIDTYLTLTRSARWWERRVDVVGELPRGATAHLLLTYHWGAGTWIWKLLRRRGVGAYFLARRPDVQDFGASRFAIWYGRFRGWGLARIGSLGPLYTGDSSRQIKEAWTRGESVVGMLDLPARETQKTMRVALLDRPARLPYGLVQLAEGANAGIVLLSCGFDLATGRRMLRLEPIGYELDAAGAMARYAAHLDARLREAPYVWHMWHEAAAIFVAETEPAPHARAEK